MLRNYIKIALKVLLRRKFFTFVSLFGISFTLLVLMLSVAALDHFFSPANSSSKLNRTLIVSRIEYTDAKTHVSSIPSFSFLDKHVSTLSKPEMVSVNSMNESIVNYVNNKKLNLELKYTDSEFWEIMELDFVEGKPFGKEAVDKADYVMVITRKTSNEYFGVESAIGQYIGVEDLRYRVIGVIENQDIPFKLAYADIFVPISTTKDNLNYDRYWGMHHAFVLAHNKSDFPAIKNEFEKRLDEIKAQDPQIEVLSFDFGTMFEIASKHFLGDESSGGTSDKIIVFGAIVLMMILFMLLPTINLVNINLSRIIERSSEIGVRKAFGASSMTLIGQFVIENVILTLIGGVNGFILSFIALKIITYSGLIPFGKFEINIPVFLYSLAICLFFGLFSGVLPAFKMSRLHPVEALKGVNL